MKKKSWLKYMVYIFLLAGAIFLKDYISRTYQVDVEENFTPYVVSMGVVIIMNMLIGVLLGLENLMEERKKEGSWKINIPKIVLMLIPSLYFSSTYILSFFLYPMDGFIQKILTYPILIFSTNGSGFIELFQLISGYILITSFYKERKTYEKNI